MSANQRFVLTLAGMLLIGIALMRVAPAQQSQVSNSATNTMETQRLVIRDPRDGKDRAVLDAEGLVLLAPNGTRVAEVTSSGMFTQVRVVSADGKRQASLQVDRNGSPLLVMRGQNNQTRTIKP